MCLLSAGTILVATPTPTPSHTQIPTQTSSYIPIYSFDEIARELEEADKQTLVVFDIDDVLITSQDMVLRPCGRHFTPSSWKDLRPSEIEYLTSIMLHSSKVILVEPSVLQFIGNLAKRGVVTMALTAARTGRFGIIEKAEDWRIRVLHELGIDFSWSFPGTMYLEKVTREESGYSLFKGGILFLGNQKMTKGEALVSFLKRIHKRPQKVLFIDDMPGNLVCVEQALATEKISFQGYLYTGVEHLSGSFDEQVADLQFAHLRQTHAWLSDAEVKRVKKEERYE
jgi:hypothetical protein